MGEARRRSQQGLSPKQVKIKANQQSQLFSISENKREQFFKITKTGAWVGIISLLVFWIIVRFIGPAAGWWVLADAR